MHSIYTKLLFKALNEYLDIYKSLFYKRSFQKYSHLVGVTYTLTILLPFIYSDFSKYQFQSPQEIKYSFGAKLHEELIMGNLLKTLQLRKNTAALNALTEYLHSEDVAS